MAKNERLRKAPEPIETTLEDFCAKTLAQLHSTLVERGASYGSFFDNSAIAIGLAELMGSMAPEAREKLDRMLVEQSPCAYPIELVHLILNAQNLIAGKHSRIAQTPLHLDSWLDIAGYAVLVHAAITMVQQKNA